MFSMQAMNQQKKKKTSDTLDKWGLKKILDQKQSMEKKEIKERFSIRKNGTNQTSDKWTLRKRMKHATYNGTWEMTQSQIFINQ